MKLFPRIAGIALLLAPILLTAAPRPNVIMVIVDDMGYSDLGCYGGEAQTPNLDTLAANGIRYTNMHNTAKCYTTRASLLTGLYFQKTDKKDFGNSATLGEVLRPSGYRTFFSGKHHAGFNPIERGFDKFDGMLGGACNFWNPGGTPRPGELEPARKSSGNWYVDGKLHKPYVPEDTNWFATDHITDAALSWLNESANDSSPFLLYLSYTAPHYPLHAHPEDIAKYDGVYDAGYEPIRQARYKRQIEMGLVDPATTPLTPSDYTQPWDSLSAEEREKEILRMQIYSAMTDRVDQNLGRIITQLEKTEKFENTLIIFLSDNGACSKSPTKFKGDLSGELGTINSFPTLRRSWANVSNTPLRNYKSDSYEGGIATPMIVHWPQGISQPGTINREPCHIIDWMPTLMQLAGASYPGESKQKDIHPYDGISLSPTFTGQPLQRGKPLFYEYAGGAAIQDGNYKLVFASKQWELFDVSVDTSESKNIIDQHPEIATRMKSEWATWYEEATGKPYPIKEKSPRQK